MISVLKLVNRSQKIYLLFLIFINIVSAILETIGIGMLPILLISILSPEKLNLNQNYLDWLSIFNFSENKNFIVFLCIFLFIFFLLKNLFFIFVKWFESKTAQSINSNISSILFKGYINLPYSMHQLQNPSIITRNIINESQNLVTYIIGITNILREVLIITFLFFLLYSQNKLLSSFIFIFLIITLIFFYLFIRKSVFDRGKIAQNLTGQQLKLISESFGAIKYIKILNLESEFSERFYRNLRKILQQNIYLNLLQVIPKLFLELLAVGSLLLLAVYAALFQKDNLYYFLPFLTLLGLILVRTIPSFNVISSALSSVKYHAPSKDLLIKEISFLKKNLPNKKSFLNKSKINLNFLNKLFEIKEVSYFYPNTKKMVLNNINLNIKPNTSVAVIGESGAGKSTLIDIILGLLEPSKGKILVDGKSLTKVVREWQSILGFIPQDIYLDDDTIKKNITFTHIEEKIDYQHLDKVLEITLLKNFINSLPDKLETQIGNRGIRLSGGQIQRIGIARCLYQKPKIIIMDEATSSLDYESERQIIKAINNIKHNTTFITIAHRLSTIKKSDVIYFLKEGRIIDRGSYSQLKKRHRKFFLNL
jgi:ATP-binding cassette subfamily C protein